MAMIWQTLTYKFLITIGSNPKNLYVLCNAQEYYLCFVIYLYYNETTYTSCKNIYMYMVLDI